ncbi:hypothetical protein BDZ89DRAFT_1078585 [Hymenopellis radicata]|nr:hypothetical protein BDZ89DRAFT_1078585 [Hymenopellis radicata]
MQPRLVCLPTLWTKSMINLSRSSLYIRYTIRSRGASTEESILQLVKPYFPEYPAGLRATPIALFDANISAYAYIPRTWSHLSLS